MQSKLTPLVVGCLLYAICVGQWSSPVPLLSGNPSIAGQALVAGAGDTMWAVVVTGQAGSAGPYQVLACWTTGDAWSVPVEVTPPDSGWVFSEPGMGRDASGRLWIAWYRGNYPTKDLDSSAVWAAFRDSAGWHPPARVCSGVPAEGPMSFASDAAGDWFLGFAALTPYKDFAYSSAVYSRLDGDSWESPRYTARGASEPFETDYYAPKLVTRPDSGLWAVYEMSIGGSSRISMMRIVQRDTVRGRWVANGTDPVATADSAGRLWILYSELAMHWVSSQMIIDSSPVDTQLITDVAEGPACVTCGGGHVDGLVWMAWPHYTSHRVMANYAFETEWSPPCQVSDSEGAPKGIAVANDRVYVVFRTPTGKLYSVHGNSTPGIQVQPASAVATRFQPTVVRGVLNLEVDNRQNTACRAAPSDGGRCGQLLDAAGRRAMSLRAGANDVSRLGPGVYFVREAQARAQAVRRVVITK